LIVLTYFSCFLLKNPGHEHHSNANLPLHHTLTGPCAVALGPSVSGILPMAPLLICAHLPYAKAASPWGPQCLGRLLPVAPHPCCPGALRVRGAPAPWLCCAQLPCAPLGFGLSCPGAPVSGAPLPCGSAPELCSPHGRVALGPLCLSSLTLPMALPSICASPVPLGCLALGRLLPVAPHPCCSGALRVRGAPAPWLCRAQLPCAPLGFGLSCPRAPVPGAPLPRGSAPGLYPPPGRVALRPLCLRRPPNGSALDLCPPPVPLGCLALGPPVSGAPQSAEWKAPLGAGGWHPGNK